jgi:hypothetical protein
MGKVAFDQFDDDGDGLSDSSWEADYLVRWLADKLLQHPVDAIRPARAVTLIDAFVQRPSRATAAACEFVKDLKNPVDFRDRWAF